MIAAWLLYATAVSAVLALAALVLERALTLYRLPTRFIWGGAMVGAVLVPLVVWLWPASAPTPTPVFDQGIGVLPAVITMPANAIGEASGGAPTFDTLLLVGWGMLSCSMLVWLSWSLWRLRRDRERWMPSTVHGVPVLVSRDEGPALVGILPATIVIPEWLLDASPATQRLALLHEREHLRASDTGLLLFAMVCIVLAPWNLALWWQAHRLRVAVEVDCDGRVLRSGVTPRIYADLLLRLSERTLPMAIPRPALAEPKSLLSRRIAGMLPLRIRARLLRAVTYGAVATGLVVLACDAPGPEEPVEPPAPAEMDGVSPRFTGTVGMSYRVVGRPADQEPRLLAPQPPVIDFPEPLRRPGISGQVQVEYLVDVDGTVVPESIRILHSSRSTDHGGGTVLTVEDEGPISRPGQVGFDAPVRDFIARLRYEPTVVEGEPVAVRMVMDAVFDWPGEVEPPTPTRIQFRGDGSIDDPLFIVDGVIIGDKSLIDLDALDIESIEVIKGATAASLYGERAKNGIVQITTKK